MPREILVLERPDDRFKISKILSDGRIKVNIALNEENFMEALMRGQEYDGVIVPLEGIDWQSFSRIIYRLPHLDKTAIILLSDTSVEEEISADAVIPRTYHPRELIQRINELLENYSD